MWGETGASHRLRGHLWPTITMYSNPLIHLCPGPQIKEPQLGEEEHQDFLWWGGQRPGEKLKEGFPRRTFATVTKEHGYKIKYLLTLLSIRLWRTARTSLGRLESLKMQQSFTLNNNSLVLQNHIMSQVWFWENKSISHLKRVNNLSF